jgi:multiple antibiotic resistance protein
MAVSRSSEVVRKEERQMEETLPLGRLALLLFTLMGPIGLIPAFDTATAGRDAPDRRRIAVQVFVFSLIGLSLAVFLGTAVMARVGTTPPSLIIAAGTILVITALRNILASGSGGSSTAVPRPVPEALPRWMPALSPITVPGIVTPVVVAVLVIFTTVFPAPASRLAILAVAGGLMVLNLAAMLAARAFMHRIGMAPLLLLGAVFGVLQVALGIEFVADGMALAILQRSGS